ncbi:unnamed protein product [Closterium sp. NIES-53]
MDDARQYALYADVDYSADGSVCSRVRSLGCLYSVSVLLCLSSICACVSALGACVASGPDTPSAEASLSFTLDSGASQCFFRNHTTLTPLLALVPVALADPSSGPAVARSSTTLPCPVVPSGVLRGLHIPSLTRNSVGVGYLHNKGITVTFVGGGRTAVFTDAALGAVLATFTRESRSGLYVLHTERSPVASSTQLAASPQVLVSSPVAVSGQVVVSGQVAASCSCRSLAHLTVLWHHNLGHLSLPRLRSMASHSLVLGLSRVFSSLPPSLGPPFTPCVAGRLRATPHSSSLHPVTAPFQTLHLNVWGPAPTLGPERERYFLVVVDDYSRYTTVFPLAKKSEVTSTLIRWLPATEGTCSSRVRCLHSDRGGEFCSGVLAGFCGEHGIRQSWTLPESPQHNGVVERRISFVMDIACTSMIHAQVSPTILWIGPLGAGSAFRVRGCLALVRNTSADKLSASAIPCIFLGFPLGSPDYSFYHPPLHQFLDSCDVRFDDSVSYYTRYPCRGLPVPPPPLFLAPSPPPAPAPLVPPPPLVLPRQSPQQPSALPRQVTVDSGGVGAGGASTGGARSGGARSRGVGAGGTGTVGTSSGGAGAGGTGTGGASSGGAGAGGAGTGGASFGGAGEGGAGGVGAGSEETRAGGSTTAAPTAPPHRHDTRFQALRQLEHEEQEHGLRALGLPSSPPIHSKSPNAYGPTFPPPDSTLAVFSPPQSHSSPPVVRHDWTRRCPPRARPSSPLADLHTVLFRSPPRRSPPVSVLSSPPELSLTVSSHPIIDYYRVACPVVSRVLTSLVTDPRASPLSVSALIAAVAEFSSTCRLDYATHVVATPPPRPLSVGGESALGCDVLEDKQIELEFLAALPPLSAPCCFPLRETPTPLRYRHLARTYVDVVPPPRANVVDGMWLFKVKRPPGSPPMFKARYVARGSRQHEGVNFFHTFALTPKMTTLRVLLHVAAQRDYELHSLDFSNALRRPVYSLRQSPREWHDTLRSTLCDLGFRPYCADPSLFVRTGSTPFFMLVYINNLVFATADRAALAKVKSELQMRDMCTNLGELQHYLGLQISRDRATRIITLTQSHMVQQELWRFRFQFSTTQPTPLAVDYRLTGPFPDEPFESSGPYSERVGCLIAVVRVAKYLATTSGMGLVLGGTQAVVLTGHCDSSYADDVETQRSTQGYCFSLGAGAVSWRSTRSSFVASSSAEAEIYAGAMAAHELRWLTFLLADLGERPRSTPTLYADNKAMILLCREPRLEVTVNHIDVRYFLLRELQRRGHARLDFVASEANTADVFTKALAPGDHHRFCVQLGLVEVGPWLL